MRYFWNAPSWARKRGYSVKSEPLGADYTAAKARCDDYLNPLFEAWRTGGDAKRIAPAGSVDWMFAEYKGSKKYTKLPARTRSGYDRAMGDVADYILKDGRRVGELHVKSVNAEFVDKIYDKLKIGPGGTTRNRSALLSVTVCKLARNVVHRNKPAIMPEVNPFKGVDIDYEPKHNRAATLAELMQFVRAADEDGTLSIGTAALLAFYWLVREEDIFTRMAWSDYRPGEQPNHVLVWHHKNRKSAKIPLPLLDVDGTELWPEMTARLDGMTRTGTLIVMRDNPDPRKKVHLPWMTGGRNPMRWVQAEVRRICRAAGLPDDITFTSFRHGGHTDGADAGLTDAQMRALGAHRSTT